MASSKLTIGDLLYRLGFENDEEFVKSLEAVLKKAETTTEKAGGDAGKAGGRAAGKGFSDQFKATFSGAALGSFLGGALQQAFSGAVNAAQRFAVDSVREFAVYEQGLLQLKLAGETNLGALSQRIQTTAKATKVFSATDVSIAVGELVKAGYDAETAFKLVEIGALGASTEVDAATGRFGDLASTSGQLGNILRALGYDTSEAGRVMDVMAKAAQDSNLNVSDLVDIAARVGPTAKLAGLEIEDLAAAAAKLSNSGMEASLIGTGLRSVLQALINPSGEMKGKLDALGVSLVDSNGNLRDWSEVLDGLNELTQRGGEGLQILTQATGSYGSTAASVLGTASDAIQAYTRDLQDAEGATRTMADTMQNSAAGAAAEMRASIANARAELGEQLMPLMRDLYTDVLPLLVDGLQGAITFFQSLKFAITGTDTVIQQVNENIIQGIQTSQAAITKRTDPAYADALRRQAEIMAHIADLENQIATNDRSTDWLGLRAGRLQDDLADARFELAGVNAELKAIDATVRQAGWTADADTPFGPLLPGQTREQAAAAAAATALVAEEYRNLAKIEAELAAAQEARRSAASREDEEYWEAEVRRLEAEKKVKEDAVKAAEAAAKKAKTEDPLVEEAQRVQNDLQRLKLAYQQDLVTREWYEDQIEQHMRRLDDKLLPQATTPQQTLAVLRARQTFLDELARLEKEAAEKSAKRLAALAANGLAQVAASSESVKVRRSAHELGRQFTQALKDGTLEPLQDLEAEIVKMLDSIGDDPSARGLVGVLTQVRAAISAAKDAAAEADRQARLRQGRLGILASMADVNEVRTQARALGVEVSRALKAGSLDGLKDLETALVKMLDDIGDDPSAAPLLGLLTAVRAGISQVTAAAEEAALKTAQWQAKLANGRSWQSAIEGSAAVRQAARDLGRQLGKAMEAGSLEQLQDLETQVVAMLKEIGDDPSAAPLVGLLTQIRAGQDQVTVSTKAQEQETRKLVNAHRQYTDSLKAAIQLEQDRALGSGVRLAKTLRELGLATREDVQKALEEQIATLNALIGEADEGSAAWYEYADALLAAYTAQKALADEVPEFTMPDLSSESALKTAERDATTAIANIKRQLEKGPDAALAAILQGKLIQWQALLNEIMYALGLLEQKKKDDSDREDREARAEAMAGELMDVAVSFPKAIVSGIQNGDISGALRNALGNASDFFLDQMLQAILGPITKELTASIAASLAAQSTTGAAGAATGAMGALGPTGWVLGGLALVASLLIGSQQRKAIAERPATAAKAAVSGAPSVTYNLTGNVTVTSNASWSDPAFQARWRSETEALLVSLLSKVRR